MCGLAGEIACAPHSSVEASRAVPMLQAILHRGPDDVGLWESERREACLLHARLSLVDIAGGHQPMSDADDTVVIAFNGEIYGFEQIRDELIADGAVFRTRSDTEVLLQLYLRLGPDFVRHLEGEFAFALVDRRNGQTMLARDRFGVKPLFVAERNGLLLFGSEAKAILAHPMMERRLDLTVLNRELHGCFLPRDSIFAGVSAIEPGTYMLVSRLGALTRRYADLDPEAAGSLRISFEDAVDALDATLSEAVRQRFHGDAPVGAFLSGGIDSGTVATLASAERKTPLSAFTIDFTAQPESECAAATQTARELALRHVVLPVDAASMQDAFETSVWHAEMTVPNPHGAAKMLLAQRAKHDVKAVLTGEGSDELHGGYAYFDHAALLAATATDGSREALSRFLANHGPRDGVLSGIRPAHRKRLAWSESGGTPYAAMRAHVARWGARIFATSDFRRQAEGPPAQALLDWLSTRAPQARMLDDVTLSRFVSLYTDLPRYNLTFLGDRMEMAAGLEGRLAFLDSRVVDLLWRLPAEFHRQNGESKRVLRAVLARRLPSAAQRAKRTFVTPNAPASGLIASALGQRWLSMDVTRRRGLFRPAAVAAARRLVMASAGPSASVFYLNSYLTIAASAHMIVDMFCERFAENLARRAPLSLAELRVRLDHAQERKRAAA